VAEFPIVPSKTAMLFFDTLNAYLHPEDPARQEAIAKSGVIDRMAKINKACREAGIAIVYGQADHRLDSKDFWPLIVDRGHDGKPGDPPKKTTSPGVILRGPKGMEVIPELAPQPGDYVIKKHRWSTFFQTHLELSLRTAGIDTVMLAGGATEVGVASTAYSARDRDFNLIFLRDVCTSSSQDVVDFFMDRVFPIFGRVMTVDQAISQFDRSGAPAGAAR
jgi:ureidoacrylate peracid hydrolase